MSGDTTVLVDAEQIVVVSESVPPPGVADVAAAVARAEAAVVQAQDLLAAANVNWDGGTPSTNYGSIEAVDGGTP